MISRYLCKDRIGKGHMCKEMRQRPREWEHNVVSLDSSIHWKAFNSDDMLDTMHLHLLKQESEKE